MPNKVRVLPRVLSRRQKWRARNTRLPFSPGFFLGVIIAGVAFAVHWFYLAYLYWAYTAAPAAVDAE